MCFVTIRINVVKGFFSDLRVISNSDNLELMTYSKFKFGFKLYFNKMKWFKKFSSQNSGFP